MRKWNFNLYAALIVMASSGLLLAIVLSGLDLNRPSQALAVASFESDKLSIRLSNQPDAPVNRGANHDAIAARQAGISADVIDNDGDGLPDDWEAQHRLNPQLGVGIDGAMGDPDGDGLPNIDEYYNFTDPRNPDTDQDGLSDLWEVEGGLDPGDPSGINGGNGDFDGDGLENSDEQKIGSSPAVSDPGHVTADH
ncbi:MAG: hypothetical protein WAU00_10750 [Caldilinea sp.]|uniref:hypothetical protein n=1 Tax=Caldilinea sp. TaxID=2293560 RepID=UPI002BD7D029|nr:hypothetical protein [Anaerolineales bacterium]HQY89963.1 hypothetical protein [Caldilinea sp.]HRA65270.1 hypothetical protein [Caldilinea sp.]